MLSSRHRLCLGNGLASDSFFLSSYPGLPSGESNNQMVNLNNLTWVEVEGTPVGSVLAICSLLLLERDVPRISHDYS